MIFLDINKDFSKMLIDNVNNDEKQDLTAEERMQLIAKATLDKRLNARDLKLYNYIICYEYLGFTQEEISELLDLSRSNINKSLEKLAAFNYIEKKEVEAEYETRKKMTYIPKGLGQTGFISCSSDAIIRALNVSNVMDSKLKYNYCSVEELKNFKLRIDEYKNCINIIEEHYNDEDEYARKKAYSLVESFSTSLKKDDALKNLRCRIEDIEKEINDTQVMTRKLNQFSNSLKSNVLNEEAVQVVLSNEDAKVILFLDRVADENFMNFKEKYLDDYIKFTCAFTDLTENEDFFKLYYENKKTKLSFSQMIKMLGFNHREVPHVRQRAIRYIEFKFGTFIESIDKSRLTKNAKSLLAEIEKLADKCIVSDAIYNTKEIALILYITEQKYSIKSATSLSFDAFVELYNPDLLQTIEELERAKKKSNNK